MPDDMSNRQPQPPGDGTNGAPHTPDAWDALPMASMLALGPSGYATRILKAEQTGIGKAAVLLRIEGTSGNSITGWPAEDLRRFAAALLNAADEADKVDHGIFVPKGLDLEGLGDLRGERPPQ